MSVQEQCIKEENKNSDFTLTFEGSVFLDQRLILQTDLLCNLGCNDSSRNLGCNDSSRNLCAVLKLIINR